MQKYDSANAGLHLGQCWKSCRWIDRILITPSKYRSIATQHHVLTIGPQHHTSIHTWLSTTKWDVTPRYFVWRWVKYIVWKIESYQTFSSKSSVPKIVHRLHPRYIEDTETLMFKWSFVICGMMNCPNRKYWTVMSLTTQAKSWKHHDRFPNSTLHYNAFEPVSDCTSLAWQWNSRKFTMAITNRAGPKSQRRG